MTIYELARQLGEEILKTPQVERVLNAKNSFEADADSVKLVEDYNALTKTYQEKMQDPKLTKEDYTSATNEMREWSERIKAHPIVGELVQAENELNAFVNSIFTIITSTVSGEDPSEAGGCSPSQCSSCKGCH